MFVPTIDQHFKDCVRQFSNIGWTFFIFRTSETDYGSSDAEGVTLSFWNVYHRTILRPLFPVLQSIEILRAFIIHICNKLTCCQGYSHLSSLCLPSYERFVCQPIQRWLGQDESWMCSSQTYSGPTELYADSTYLSLKSSSCTTGQSSYSPKSYYPEKRI